MLALGLVSLAGIVVSLAVSKLIHNAVPVVLVFMPFFIGALGCLTVVGLGTTVGLPAALVGAISVLAAYGTYKFGDKLANDWFTGSIMR